MLIELGKDGAKLQDETAVIAGEVNGTLKNLASRPVLGFAVALKPVLNADLRGLLGFCFFGLSDRICLF